MKPGGTAYIRLPNADSRREMTPATVIGARPEHVDLSIAVLDASITVDCEVVVLYDVEPDHQFLQQTARIESIRDSGTRKLLELELTSDSISAESRRHQRFTALTSGAVVHLAGRACPVRDVSVAGFAVVSPDNFELDQSIAVALEVDGERYRGEVNVRSRGEPQNGYRRYGMLDLESSDGDHSLGCGLRTLTRYIERIRQKDAAEG